MKLADWIILGILLVGFGIALFYCIKHPNECGSCKDCHLCDKYSTCQKKK